MSRLRSWTHWIGQTVSRQRSEEGEDLLLNNKPTSEKHETTTSSLSPLQDLQVSYRRLKHSFIIITLLLGCVIVIVALPWYSQDGNPYGGRGAGRSPVPEISSSRVTFQQDDRFASASSLESDAAWSAMMPAGDGFVVVDNPHKFQLPPGKETRYGQVYDISMWHQLHCLSHMRTYLYTMQSYLNRTGPIQQVFDVVLAPQEGHILHCFDYLRQAIMCAGDMTLEWPRTEADGRRFAVDGWGVEHQCKSWEAMADYVEQHAVGRHHLHDGSLQRL